MSRDPAGFLPLQPHVFEMLLALSERASHGYGILKELEARDVQMAPSLLYRRLRRLMADDLVGEAARPAHPGDDQRRRYYRLTPLGRSVLKAEASRIAGLAREPQIRRLAESSGHA